MSSFLSPFYVRASFSTFPSLTVLTSSEEVLPTQSLYSRPLIMGTVVGRIMALQDVPVLLLRTCECVTVYGIRVFVV